jgi:hypothetical protein
MNPINYMEERRAEGRACICMHLCVEGKSHTEMRIERIIIFEMLPG